MCQKGPQAKWMQKKPPVNDINNSQKNKTGKERQTQSERPAERNRPRQQTKGTTHLGWPNWPNCSNPPGPWGPGPCGPGPWGPGPWGPGPWGPGPPGPGPMGPPGGPPGGPCNTASACVSGLISCCSTSQQHPQYLSETDLSKQRQFVCWLLNIPATCKCISGTDLLRQFYVLPHWDRSCRSNFPSHPVTVYWHQADQSQRWPYNARHLAG